MKTGRTKKTELETAKPGAAGARGGSGCAAAAVLAVGVIGGAIAVGGSANAATGDELSVEEIVDIVNAKGLGTIYEVERERNKYEVAIEDPQGKWIELELDARTGEVLREELDDDD